tara:strand:- start:8802 stop:9722 length:921 start_codon:yes stop_codon:yes gene_type:complete
MHPKISILMNCYNGEAYLREALDSVFQQSFTDWQLVFVDNCSTDSSFSILSDYNQEKVKYIKTDKNVLLGEARNLGIKHCLGTFISFLDCDDVYYPDALQKAYDLISSSNCILAYGGHDNINSKGEIIGKHQTQKNDGDLFSKLLLQYDIPIVSTIVSRSLLGKSCLNFDSNIVASEEYCLFMQLAAKYKIISTEEILLKYRIHDNALTNGSISKWGAERRYTLDKIVSENPHINKRYHRELQLAYARSFYYDAQYFMSLGERKLAKLCLSKSKYLNFKYFLLYILVFFPYPIWQSIQKIKYKRNL